MWKYLIHPVFPVFLRLKAINRVVQDGVTAALPQLRAALTDPDHRIRAKACWAVKVFRDPESVEPLLALFHQGETYYTVDALAEIGGTRVIDAMLAIVRDRGSRFGFDSKQEFRWSEQRFTAAKVLARAGEVQAVEPLLKLGDEYRGPYPRPDRRQEAARLVEDLLSRSSPNMPDDVLRRLAGLENVTETREWQERYEADPGSYVYESGIHYCEETKTLVDYADVRKLAEAELCRRQAQGKDMEMLLRVAAEPSQPTYLEFTCVACGKKLRAKVALAGREVRCPKCQHDVPVPEE